MNKKLVRSFLITGALSAGCATFGSITGCVADRPARNGVFNENQYIRKDFLVRSGTGTEADPGWIFRSTVLATSAPNPLANLGLFVGADNTGGDSSSPGTNYVRFAITEDKLQLINMRELSAGYAAQAAREPEIVNAWPVTNVDLKYRVNLDGETTNFYEENQELDWQVRQWVKLNLDKNDLSDVAPLGSNMQSLLKNCSDTGSISTTLVPGSFNVDETNNYMTWQVQITAPVTFDKAECTDAYGATGLIFNQVGRSDVTFTLMYSLVRAAPDSNIWTPERANTDGTVKASTYVPFVLGEKDPIRKKYGIFESIVWDRDPNTGLLAGTELLNRYNPNAQYMDWFFAEGYPSQYEAMWTAPGGYVQQTNQLFADAGAKLQMRVWRYNDDVTGSFGNGAGLARQFGDVRYNFVHWVSDLDVAGNGSIFLGDTPSLNDPRTGERISTVINIADFDLYDFYGTKLDFYLGTIGALPTITNGQWPVVNTSCYVGQTYPLTGLDFGVGGTVQTQHNEISTVYDKMQLYLHKPSTTYGYLNPANFIPQESPDFFDAFFKIMPYQVFRDPATNPFVTPEGGKGYYAPEQMDANAYATRSQFHALMSVIDKGEDPYHDDPTVGYVAPPNSYDGTGGGNDIAAAMSFTDTMKALNTAVFNQRYAVSNPLISPVMDTPDIVDNFTVLEKDSRHCVWNDLQDHSKGTHWESRPEYLTSLVQTVWQTILLHEFGHAVGLRHNFMGSVDRQNFPTWTDVGPITASHPSNVHYGAYTSSIMDYNIAPDRYFWAGGIDQGNGTTGNAAPWATKWNDLPGWMPYDMGAISFLYGNNLDKTKIGPYNAPISSTVSGQSTPTKNPWNDVHGFTGNTEINFLFCTDEHVHYTPFCRRFDFGTTPSEIVASAIDTYEWDYKWRNFRLYNKFWNDGPYADNVNGTFVELRRFLSTWAYDWSDGELIENFPKVGVLPPANNTVPLIDYYSNLAQAFTNDISVANQMVAAFHKAIIQQSSGERPYVTTYDPFYGDVVQQGIIIDKLLALQNWTSLYKLDNYDPTQSAGAYLFAATPFDSNYQSVAEDALNSMIGGQYDVFQYVSPLSIQMFAEASHDINFTGRTEIRDWIGGKVFGGPGLDPNRQFLTTMRSLAQSVNAQDIDPVVFAGCSPTNLLTDCLWDPRIVQANTNDVYHSDPYNEFRGPDGRRYSWAFVTDRNQIALVDRDRNTASYIVLRNYNQDVVTSQDDGSGGAYQLELPIKYTMDAFATYN